MKRFGRGVMAAVLAAGMTVMSLSACGSGETKNDTDAVGKTAEAGKTTATENAAGDNAAEKAAGDNAGDKTAEKTVEGKAAGKAATIRYEWWGGSATHEAYTGLQARYKELKPEVTIEPEYSAFDGYQEKVVTQLAGGTIADLFHIDAPWMQEWVSRGDYFVDLSKQDILDYSGIGQELLDQYCMFDGKLLAVPMGVQCSGMLVNTAAAKKYGLEIDRQLTWEEIIDLGKKLHTADPEAYLFIADRGHIQNAIMTMLKQRTGGQVINDDYTIAFTKEDLLYVYNIIKKSYDAGVFEPLGEADLYYGSTTPNPKWINGQSIGQLVWNSEFTKVDDLLEGKDEATMILWPTIGEGAKQGSSRIRPTYLVGLSNTSKEQETALTYLNWQLNDPEAAEILGSVRAVPTSKTQQEAAVSAGVLRQPVIDALDEAYTNVQVKDNEPSQNSELQDAMTDEFSKVVYGMATPEEAVESTFGTLEEVLERISK